MADSNSKPSEEQAHPNQASNPQLDPVQVEKPRQDEGKSDNLMSKPEEEGAAAKEEEEEEEEAGECGFCLFMKGGGCKESFIAWEQCVEESEEKKEDIVEKCFQVTTALKKCMEAHSDYYQPILKAEKAAEAEVVKEMDKEKAAASESSNAATLEILEHHSEDA